MYSILHSSNGHGRRSPPGTEKSVVNRRETTLKLPGAKWLVGLATAAAIINESFKKDTKPIGPKEGPKPNPDEEGR